MATTIVSGADIMGPDGLDPRLEHANYQEHHYQDNNNQVATTGTESDVFDREFTNSRIWH